MAGHAGLRGIPRPDLPRIAETLREGGYFSVPLIALVLLFAFRLLARRGRCFGPFCSPLASGGGGRRLARARAKRRYGELSEGFRDGGINTIEVAAICAAAEIIIGVTTMTGFGLRVSSIVVDLAGRQLVAGRAAGGRFVAYPRTGYFDDGQLRHPGDAGRGLRSSRWVFRCWPPTCSSSITGCWPT